MKMNIIKQWLLNCGYDPQSINKWRNCKHENIIEIYEYVDYIDKNHKLEPFNESKIRKSHMCKNCNCPQDALDKINFCN